MIDINEYKHDLAVRLRMLMDYSGKTREQIAEEACISSPVLFKYLSEKHSPKAYSLICFADALKCPASWLIDPSTPIPEEDIKEWRKSLI